MLRSWVKKAAIKTGATRLGSSFVDNGVAILMYHSVTDDPNAHAEILGGINHSTSTFKEQMEVLAREYHPISLDEASVFVQGQKDLPRRSVVVTFDDGYADNYDVAMPLLNKIGVPATFYVTVDPVEKRRLPWPARMRYAIFITKNSAWVDPDGQTWPLAESRQREKAFERACEYCCKLAGTEQDEFVSASEGQLQCALTQAPAMMTWDDVRGTVKQGHIIGSHTMTHPNMAHIKQDAVRQEMAESKKILERELGAAVVHFSYPCPALQPHWTERTVMVSQQCGYQTAVTTNRGVARRNDNPLQLKRIMPSKTVDGLRANLEFGFLGFRR